MSLKDEWKALSKEIDDADRARQMAQNRILAKEEEFLQRLAKEINIPREEIDLGGWPCETSPIGECIYNHDVDPMNDDCLFCHQPNERK